MPHTTPNERQKRIAKLTRIKEGLKLDDAEDEREGSAKELRSIANTPTNMGCMSLCELLSAALFHYEVISASRLALDTPGTGREGFPAVA